MKDKTIDPDQVKQYLEKSFGDDLKSARDAMKTLAKAFKKDELADKAFSLYERFRPKIAAGQRGWGQKGTLELKLIEKLGTGD